MTLSTPPCGTTFEGGVERIALHGTTKRDDIVRLIIETPGGRHEVDVDDDGRFVQIIDLVPGDNVVTVRPLIPTTETPSGWLSPDMYTLVFYRAAQ